MRRHATSTGTRATTLTDLGRRVESPATTRSSSSSSSPSSSSSSLSSSSSSSSLITSLPPTRSAFHRLPPFGRAASFPIVSPASAVYATTAVFTDTHLCPISSCLCASGSESAGN